MKTTLQVDEATIKNLGLYMLDTKGTVRSCSKAFGIPRSTTYEYLTKHLAYVDPQIHCMVLLRLKLNKAERASRGGRALCLKLE